MSYCSPWLDNTCHCQHHFPCACRLEYFLASPTNYACIRLARLKFELINQDSVGGKNCTVLTIGERGLGLEAGNVDDMLTGNALNLGNFSR